VSGESVSRTIEHLLRDLAPQVLGALTRRHKDFALAEDAVQEALIAAASRWPSEGMPSNPSGWLYHVALRRFTDHLRSEMARRRREDAVATDVYAEWAFVPSPDETIELESDDTLTLLFMCCHPALTDATAIALTLRAVGGLTTAEIASAFLVPEPTMAQRISRAKQTIKSSKIPFEMPSESERTERMGSVMHVLYLIFNEGYTSSSGTQLQRTDLSNEAIRLARLLQRLVPNDGEVSGLLALMLLTDARRMARTGAHGELIPLDEQDRSRWNREMIAEGNALVSEALNHDPVGPYALQAAIAAVHSLAESVDATDWRRILMFYDVLHRMSDNPMITLNRAIAIAMVHGPQMGLEALKVLDSDVRIAGHYRLDAVKAHLYERAGETDRALQFYQSAAERTTSTPERNYLAAKAVRIAKGVAANG
jgi:RNA polymerase sigma factor (sigma-70 family)